MSVIQPAIQPFGLADMVSASRFIDFEHDAQAAALQQLAHLPRAMREWKKNPTSHQLMALRCDALSHLALAFATQNQACFGKLADGLLAYPLAMLPKLRPSRTQLLVDLALAISTRRHGVAKKLAGHIFELREPACQVFADDIYADLLARLYDLQFDAADQGNRLLREMVEAKRFDQVGTAYAAVWSSMVASLLARDSAGLVQAATEMTSHRREHLNRLLASWAGGWHTELQELDFWDIKTTALLAIADSFGLWPEDLDPATIAFANWHWTQGRE